MFSLYVLPNTIETWSTVSFPTTTMAVASLVRTEAVGTNLISTRIYVPRPRCRRKWWVYAGRCPAGKRPGEPGPPRRIGVSLIIPKLPVIWSSSCKTSFLLTSTGLGISPNMHVNLNVIIFIIRHLCLVIKGNRQRLTETTNCHIQHQFPVKSPLVNICKVGTPMISLYDTHISN